MLQSYKTLYLTILFYLFVAIVLVTRVLLLLNLNLDAIDSDMPFMWLGVKDYSEGLFYEPRFYGQDYNTFIESLFAVPLYWIGVPVYYALPIVAHVEAIAPFLFTAFYLFYKGRKENALFVLAIFLCLTPGYDVMTSQPRGISGVFLTAFFVLSLTYPKHMGFLILNTLLTVLGYFVTPNSVVVSVPLMAYLFFMNYKDKKYYFITACCLFSVVPFYLIFDKFYKDHPEYIVYGLDNWWGFSNFQYAISNLDQSFGHISFFIEEICATVLLSFLILGVALYRKNKIAFLAFLSFIGMLLFSFFASKVQQGVVWPFYSFSRMYIGVPMVIVLFSTFFQIRSQSFVTVIVLLALGYSVFKFVNFKSSLAYHTDEKRWNGIHLVPLKTIQEGCVAFKDICHEKNVDYLLISNTFWLCTYLNYGGQVLYDEFPETQETKAERRYWVREKNKNKVFKRFIFLSVDYNIDKTCALNTDFRMTRLNDYGLMLIEENRLTNDQFITLVNTIESD